MVIRTVLIAENIQALDTRDVPLNVAVHDVLDAWNEDTTPQAFLFIEETTGQVLASILRDRGNHEIAHLTFDQGTKVSVWCRYHLDAAGRYLNTSVDLIPGTAVGEISPPI